MTTTPPRPSEPKSMLLKPSSLPLQKCGARIVLVGEMGWGKTSISAGGPNPIIIAAPGENGYLTLFQRGLVPECDVAMPGSWPDLLSTLSSITRMTPARTVVLDALVGFESLCASHVCETEFGGDWGEKGFMAYGRGKGIVQRTWPLILPRFDALVRHGHNVMVLAHAQIRRFDNPVGAAYDRYEANVAPEVWARTKAWAECVCFGTFLPIIDEGKNKHAGKGKAVGHARVMHCQYSAVADAKNQYGLEPRYTMPDEPRACADAFWSLMFNSKKES